MRSQRGVVLTLRREVFVVMVVVAVATVVATAQDATAALTDGATGLRHVVVVTVWTEEEDDGRHLLVRSGRP